MSRSCYPKGPIMWHPADFVLRGEYCPSETIEYRLENYRDRYCLGFVALFVSTEPSGSMPSMIFWRSADSEGNIGNELAALALDGKVAREISEAAFSPPREQQRNLARVADELGERWAPQLNGFGYISLNCPEQILVNQPVRPVLLTCSSRRTLIERKHLELLYTMILSHVEVRQRIDALPLTPLDDLLLVPETAADGAVDLRAMAERATSIVRSRTPSLDCVVVWRSSLPHGGWTASVDEFLADAVPSGMTLTGFVEQIRSDTQVHQYGGSATRAVVAPIPGVLAGPDSPAVGMLLAKFPRDEPVTAHGLNFLRAVCLRLAILYATAANGRVARLIADIASAPLARPPASVGAGSIDPDEVPADVALALNGLDGALERIAANTNSHSASIRIALGHAGGGEPHGLALRRIVAVPADSVESDVFDWQFPGPRSGVNWRTMRTGRICDVPDVHADPDYMPTRPDTGSELSIPIRAGGQLIGTLNLESPSRSNYGIYLPYIEAVADSIGRRFADAGLAVGRPILERAAEVLDTTHDYQSNLVRLREHARNLPVPEGSRKRIDTFIEECLALIRSATIASPDEPPGPPQASVRWLLEAAMDRAGVVGLQVDDAEVPELDMLVDPTSAALILSVIQGILANITKHGGVSSAGNVSATMRPHVDFDSCFLDGRRYLVIRFSNSSREALIPGRAAEVYRMPIERRGELRLGAYLSGMRLRQVGGRVSFCVEPSGVARTSMMLPVSWKE